MRRSLRGLDREGFRHVHIFEKPEDLDGLVIELQPLWNNLRHEHGPFDIIGDVHGCLDERATDLVIGSPRLFQNSTAVVTGRVCGGCNLLCWRSGEMKNAGDPGLSGNGGSVVQLPKSEHARFWGRLMKRLFPSHSYTTRGSRAPATVRYGVAVLAVVISTLVGLWLRPATYISPYVFFYPAILLALWFGGFWTGLLATVLTAAVVDYFFIAPYYRLLVTSSDVPRAVYFILSFALICWLIDRRQFKAEGEIDRQAKALELANDAIFILDVGDKIEFWNRGAGRLYGWTPAEALGQCAHDLLHTKFPVPLHRIMAQTRELGEWRGELVHTTRDGKTVLVASSWTPRFDARGELVGTFEINRDITGQRQTEAALQTAEKLATVGRLSSTIVHEINNPLGALENITYILQRNPSLDESARGYIEMAKTELAQISQITRYTLGLTRDASHPVPVDIAQTVEEVSNLYLRRPQFRSVRVERRYDTQNRVMGYPGEIRQVISNLVVNACEAAGETGTVQIHVFASRDWKSLERAGVRVLVANNGSAIPPEHRDRIFEPFFTTKGEAGNGLGLWISRNVVAKHNGSITVKSCRRVAKDWTFFSVFFPTDGPAHNPTATDPEGRHLGKSQLLGAKPPLSSFC